MAKPLKAKPCRTCNHFDGDKCRLPSHNLIVIHDPDNDSCQSWKEKLLKKCRTCGFEENSYCTYSEDHDELSEYELDYIHSTCPDWKPKEVKVDKFKMGLRDEPINESLLQETKDLLDEIE